MTRKKAEALGWELHEGRKPQLVPDGESSRVLRGHRSAEKTFTTRQGTAITRRVEVETFELDGWPDLERRLLMEIEKTEAVLA